MKIEIIKIGQSGFTWWEDCYIDLETLTHYREIVIQIGYYTIGIGWSWGRCRNKH